MMAPATTAGQTLTVEGVMLSFTAERKRLSELFDKKYQITLAENKITCPTVK